MIVPSYVEAHWFKKGRGQSLLDKELSFSSFRSARDAIVLTLYDGYNFTPYFLQERFMVNGLIGEESHASKCSIVLLGWSIPSRLDIWHWCGLSEHCRWWKTKSPMPLPPTSFHPHDVRICQLGPVKIINIYFLIDSALHLTKLLYSSLGNQGGMLKKLAYWLILAGVLNFNN